MSPGSLPGIRSAIARLPRKRTCAVQLGMWVCSPSSDNSPPHLICSASLASVSFSPAG
jgi:hypothetical protein